VTETKRLDRTTERLNRQELKGEKARVISRRQPLTVPAGTTLSAAIERMQDANAGVVLVTEGERAVGVLTEGDIVRRVLADGMDLSRPVDDAMSREPRTLHIDSTLGEAMSLMQQGGYRVVPLVDDEGRIAGIVHQRELIEYVAEAFPQEILNLPPRPHQQMEEPEGA
jgi:CBS domain-containing protein